MKIFSAIALALAVTALPALAKQFVQDQAGMLSADTVSSLNSRISNFNSQTGKEIVVQTVPSVAGGDVRTAAENAFAQQQVNGVLIFIDKGDRRSYIIGDRAATQAGWWSSQTASSIVQSMNAQFRAGDYDGGVTTAVNSVFDIYRSHLGSLRSTQPVSQRGAYAQQQSQGGVHISVFWWIIIALFAFFIIRSLMRAASGPRYYGGGPMGPGGGPGYGPGYGYGGGYGWGGGGGGFWSGLLGGLGGAWLGNELFGGGRNWGGGYANVDPNAAGGNIAPSDGGGWQSDPGQADMGGSAGGDWGGGGFGGGDFGGGGGGFGGGDFGGGGGDAGGGW